MDLLKSLVLSGMLGGFLLFLLLNLVLHGGKNWWLWAWIVVGLFELLMLWLYPRVIAPLFNKFEPISDPGLEHSIKSLAEKTGLRVKGIFKMDASKRSKHTNAYFTGIGKSKRIILFDTLLGSHTADEVLAVLAHEIGHWKKKHVLRQLFFVEILSLLGFMTAAAFLNRPVLYRTFGVPEPTIYVGLFLMGVFFGVVSYFIQPLESALSRRFEGQADDFARDVLGEAKPMRQALKRLAADNLSNLVPHPLVAWFYYSHPPVIERIERLRNKE